MSWHLKPHVRLLITAPESKKWKATTSAHSIRRAEQMLFGACALAQIPCKLFLRHRAHSAQMNLRTTVYVEHIYPWCGCWWCCFNWLWFCVCSCGAGWLLGWLTCSLTCLLACLLACLPNMVCSVLCVVYACRQFVYGIHTIHMSNIGERATERLS